MKKYMIEVIAALFVLVSCAGTVMAAHSVVLTWTKPTSSPSGALIYIYRGTAPLGESSTPINPSGVDPNIVTFTDTNVQANSKYYYTAKQCATDLASGDKVCSDPSNEASGTVPLASGDLPTIVGLGAVGK